MNNKGANRIRHSIMDNLMLVGIGLGILFWLLESSIHVFVFHEGSLIRQIFTPGSHEIWMRTLVVGILIMLGVYAQVLITERKRAEEKLKEYTERLEEMVEERTKELREAQEELVRKERLAVLGHFSGSISHELRNPLGVIDSSVYYLKMKLGDSDEKVRQHLERIKSSVNSVTAIVQSLLNLTRVKKPDVEKNDLVFLVSESLRSSKIPDKVAVMRHFPDKEIPVNVEREQIRMALKNIIKNGVEALNGAGTLSVTIRKTEKGQAELIFKDTGPGIMSENLEKIFQPLFSTRAQGIGFGLSITKMIIENHGGTIEAESEPGKGAAFIITFPLVGEGDQEDEKETEDFGG